MFSGRQLLAVSAVGAAMTTTDARAQPFGNPDLRLVAQHLNVDLATIARWPDDGPGVMPILHAR